MTLLRFLMLANTVLATIDEKEELRLQAPIQQKRRLSLSASWLLYPHTICGSSREPSRVGSLVCACCLFFSSSHDDEAEDGWMRDERLFDSQGIVVRAAKGAETLIAILVLVRNIASESEEVRPDRR